MVLAYQSLGDVLTAHGAVSSEQLDSAVGHARDKGLSLSDALLSLRYCSEEVLLKARASQLGVEFLDELDPDSIDPHM